MRFVRSSSRPAYTSRHDGYPRASRLGLSVSGLVLSCLATAQAQGTAPNTVLPPAAPASYQPLPRPEKWPFALTTVVRAARPSPLSALDPYIAYRDRPFSVEEGATTVYGQVSQLQTWVPGAVMLVEAPSGIDTLPRDATPPDFGRFSRYLEAARRIPGARVAPLLTSISSEGEVADEGSDQAREDAVYQQIKTWLDSYGKDSHWWNVKGVPIITDQGTAGLGVSGIGRVSARLRADGYDFYWLPDAPTSQPLLARLYGQVDAPILRQTLPQVSGMLPLNVPLTTKRGSPTLLAKILRAYPQGRAFGMSANESTYDVEGTARDLVAAHGTERLRQSLNLARTLHPDVLNLQTWNDYSQGSAMSPSYAHTSALLEIARCYADALKGQPHVADTQPHLIASYRKSLLAGELLEVELLNLPVRQPFGALYGRVEVRNRAGQIVARLPFAMVGNRVNVQTLRWRTPGSMQGEMLDVRVLVSAKTPAGTLYQRTYLNMPPVPVVSEPQLADPLTFHVPLHRLWTVAPVELLLNGSPNTASAPFPRLLSARAKGDVLRLPRVPVAGIAYLRSGAVINDPTPATAHGPVLDNFPDDPLRAGELPAEYYGALVEFSNGMIAYTTGLWCQEPAVMQGRVMADYGFWGNANRPREKNAGLLLDRSGHGYTGQLAQGVEGKGAAPSWVPVAPLHRALRFDGQSSVVNLKDGRAFPVGLATVETVIRPGEIGRPQALVTQGGELLNLLLDADGRVRVRHADSRGDFDDVLSITPLKAGHWYHIVATFDMNRVRLYLDGQLESEVPTDGLRPVAGARLGGPYWEANDPRRGRWDYFRGDMARFRVLQGVSSPEQVRSDALALTPIYQLGR